MNLSNTNCYVGVNPNNIDGSGQGIGFTSNLVDLGYQNMESRHTVHYDLNEVDPRTDGRLHTIPEGEVASVRLGN